MATLWGRIPMALTTAWRILTTPGAAYVAPDSATRLGRYDYLWAWETGTVFAVGAETALRQSAWAESLKQALRLYRHTRLVWNPFPDLTDFWGSVVYPGTLTRDGTSTDERPSAIPFTQDTQSKRPQLVAAAAQVYWWSNLQQHKYTIPYWAACAGNMLLEVEDDWANQKVYLRPRWAGMVRDLELSSAGDVQYYALQYQAQPEGALQEHTYRLEVSKQEYRTFKDGKPWGYEGRPPVWPNDWGFVPACWVPHQPTGGDYGAPAIGAWLQELLEINSLQSMLDDDVARATKPIWVFATDGSVLPLYANGKAAATSELDPSDAGRESITAFKVPTGTGTSKLDPSANIADVAAYLAERKREFYRHFPELSMWESLRQRDVSGIAAEILHGDTRNKVLTVRPATDRQLEKATQMAISMAAIRRARSWTIKDARRAVFEPFNENSFAAGDLDFEIDSRPLVPDVPLSDVDKAALAKLRQELGLPDAWVFEQLGVPEDVITVATAEATAAAAAQEAARAAALAMAQAAQEGMQNGGQAQQGNTEGSTPGAQQAQARQG